MYNFMKEWACVVRPMTKPGLSLGMLVSRTYKPEHSKAVLTDIGVITGCLFAEYSQTVYKKGWWYHVTFIQLPSSPWLRTPFTELCHESELTRLCTEYYPKSAKPKARNKRAKH